MTNTTPTEETATMRRQTAGAWIVYDGTALDIVGPVAISIHADELDARRTAMDDEEPRRVVFVPWDATIHDSLTRDKELAASSTPKTATKPAEADVIAPDPTSAASTKTTKAATK